MAKTRYELKAGVNRVEIAVQESDSTLVVTDSGYETSDPLEQASLETAEGVKRAEKQSKEAKD